MTLRCRRRRRHRRHHCQCTYARIGNRLHRIYTHKLYVWGQVGVRAHIYIDSLNIKKERKTKRKRIKNIIRKWKESERRWRRRTVWNYNFPLLIRTYNATRFRISARKCTCLLDRVYQEAMRAEGVGEGQGKEEKRENVIWKQKKASRKQQWERLVRVYIWIYNWIWQKVQKHVLHRSRGSDAHKHPHVRIDYRVPTTIWYFVLLFTCNRLL